MLEMNLSFENGRFWMQSYCWLTWSNFWNYLTFLKVVLERQSNHLYIKPTVFSFRYSSYNCGGFSNVINKWQRHCVRHTHLSVNRCPPKLIIIYTHTCIKPIKHLIHCKQIYLRWQTLLLLKRVLYNNVCVW